MKYSEGKKAIKKVINKMFDGDKLIFLDKSLKKIKDQDFVIVFNFGEEGEGFIGPGQIRIARTNLQGNRINGISVSVSAIYGFGGYHVEKVFRKSKVLDMVVVDLESMKLIKDTFQ